VPESEASLVVVVQRLTRRSDFRAVARGLRVSSEAFLLQALKRAEGGAARVGFTVSRQVGSAVERNRVRRRLREMVRISAAEPAALRPGHDYVLIGRRAALAAPFSELQRAFGAALGRIHRAGRADKGGDPCAESLHETRPAARPRHWRRKRTGRRSQSTTQSADFRNIENSEPPSPER
jgi:ribonuclease P protein component